MFWLSRADATSVAPGASRRAVSVTRTEVSSRSVATTMRAAVCTEAVRRTSSRVASPTTPTAPSAVASSISVAAEDTTTISCAGVPCSTSALNALRPLTPNPTTTVWSCTVCLQRLVRNSSRLRCVSTSTVVPTSVMRKTKRSGVMTRMLASRACSVAGTMSPYPVVERVTVA